MQPWTLALCAALLCGCAGPSPAPRAAAPMVFHDQLFQPPAVPVDTAHIFALSPAMRDYLSREIGHSLSHKDPRRELFDALYRKDRLQLEYDSAITRDAAQTFAARAGNCLSLAIMTAALARELNLVVQFQQVEVDESWSRAGDLYFASNHVNLALGRQRLSHGEGYSVDLSNSLTVDFIPIPPKARENAKPLEEQTIVAMYLNNRAAELLAQGKLDEAYWSARKAVEQDPGFLHAYNTLAVVYQHHGNLAEAEQALRYAISQAPANTIVISNLAQALEAQHQPDKQAEAAMLRDRLALLEPEPPFHFFNLGQEAMRAGDYRRARDLFAREVERVPDYHEFHFWLALANYQLGNLGEADVHMVKALANSTTRGDHDLYSAKLDRIRAYEAHAAGK
ncbi:tetratricopeptide repeat protein [Rugamonas sp. FT82W]|uniref:Tetratricopeptide repeat protein n=1 Tax=Duganella vulcania TaxID=2692166 RepID=A0A845GES3_9BURK|nr:tetratricopeptide repeat protein [Duganella vulcania]MYM91716.1 tetratricopeptide repeat protein [Duganella vulcania]